MIKARELLNRLGKKEFTKFVLKNKDKEKTKGERLHARRFGTNVKYRMCQHGVWVIENYKPVICEKCHEKYSESPLIVCHDHEYFNVGTGTYGTNSEHRRYAREQGLEEAG